MVKGRRRNQRGQSIIEYLVVVAAIIAVIVGIGAAVGNKTNQLATSATNSMDKADTAITTNIDAQRQ